MEYSRILIALFVFLMMWKETLNQQLRPQNNVQERSKRHHEIDHDDYLRRVKQVNILREKKNVPTERVNPNDVLTARGRSLNLSLENKAPAKTYIPSRKIVRIKPLQRNTKNIAIAHKPYVSSVHNHDLAKKTDEQNKVNKTIIQKSEVKVEEKEQVIDEVIDTKIVNNTLSLNIEKTLQDNFKKPVEELINIQLEEPQTMKPKTKSKSTKNESKTKKPFAEECDENMNMKKESKKVSEKRLKINEPIITPIIKEVKGDDKIKDEVTKETEEITVGVMIGRDSATESVKTEDILKPLQVDVIKPRKHPFLEAIQNDSHISCPINSEPYDDEVSESRNDNSVEANKKTALNLDLIDKLSQKTENNDKNEGVIIKNHNYEEVMEISRTPNDPASCNFIVAQHNIAPVPYDNPYQVPYDNYQVPQAEFDLNNHYNQYDSSVPNEQRIDQIDGSTVVSYNNYYQMPPGYGNSNYNANINNNPLNSNTNYGYVPARPSLGVGNIWNNNKNVEKQFQSNPDAINRIWRTWKNTEYYIKSKNALKQLSNEQFHNLVKQNNGADKIKYIHRRNAVDVNGYYGIKT